MDIHIYIITTEKINLGLSNLNLDVTTHKIHQNEEN